MDIDDIYNDLDNFQVEEVKNAELLALEAKYQESLTTIDQLKADNADLQKKVKTMQVNFQNLLDTAKAEIRRKDKQIAELRMEKDDLCFRRKQPKPARPSADGGIVHAKQRGNSNLEATTMSAYNDANPTVGTEQQGHSTWVPATTTQQPFEAVPRTAAAIEPAERSSRSRADERIQRTREHHTDGEKHSSCDSRGRRERSSSRRSRSDALERKRGHYESESSGSTYEKSEREHRGREEERHRELRKDSRDSHRETIRPRRKSPEKHRNVYEERHSRHSSHDKRESSKNKSSDRDNERGKSAHDRKDTVRLTSKEAQMQALEADFTQIANSTHHKREKHMSKNDDQQDTARQEQHNQKRHERDKVKPHNEHKMEHHLRRKSDDTSGEIAKVNPRIDKLQQHGNCSTKVAPHVNRNNENGVLEIPTIENIAQHAAGTENTVKVALPKMDENSNVTRALQQFNTPKKAALYDSLFGETPSSVESVSSNLLNNVMNLLQSGGGSNDSNSTALSVCTDNADAQAQVQNDFADAKRLVEQYFVENAADSGVKPLNTAVADISDLSDIASEYIPGLGDSPLCKRTSMNRGVFGFLMKHNEVIEIEDDINIDVTDEEHNDKVSLVAIESGNESRKSVHDDSNGKADIVILEDIQLPHIFKLEERETELLRIKNAAGEEQREEFELKVANGDIEDQQVKNDEKNAPISLREVGSQQPASLREDNINTLNEGEFLKPTNDDRDAISLLNEIVSSSETLKEKDKSASEAEIVGGANKEYVESEADFSTKSKGFADKQSEASSFGPNEIAVTVRKLENSSTVEMPTLDAESKTVSVGKEESTKANFQDAENLATADQLSKRSAEAAVTPTNIKQIEMMAGDAEKMKVNVSDLAASRTLETLLAAKVEHALHSKNYKDEATVQLKTPYNSASLGFEGAEAMTVSVELPRKDVDRKTAELETETFAQCGNVNELLAGGEKLINNFTTDNENLEKVKHLKSPNNVDDCYGNKEQELAGRSEMEKKEESMSQSKEQASKFTNLPVAHSAHKSDKHLNIKSTECKTTEEAINCVEAIVDSKSTLDRVAKETQSQVKVKTNEGKVMQQIVDRTLEMAVTKNTTQSAISANVKEYNSKNENGLKTLLAAAQLSAKQSPPVTEAEIADTLIKLKNSTPNEADVVKALENSTEKQKSSTAGTHVSKVAQKQVDKEANNCEKEVEHVQDTYPRNGDADVEDAVSYIVHSVSCQATSGARSSFESVENNMKLIETPKLNETTQVKSKLKPTKRSIQKPAAKLEQKLEEQQIEKLAGGLGRRKKKVTPALVERKGKQVDAQKVPNAGKKVSGPVDKKNYKFDSKLGIEIIDLEKLDNDEIKSVKADDLKMVQGLNTLKESEMEAEKAATVIQQHTEPLLGHSEKTSVVLPAINCLLIENNSGLQAINKFKIPKLATKKDEQIKVPSVAADKQVKNSPNCAKRQMPKVKAHNKAEHTKAKTLKSAAGAQQCTETTQIPSEFLEMPNELEQSATEVEKQLKDAHNACEERELKNARATNETADPSEVTNSLPESTIEFLEEQKAMLKRKLSECCLDVSSDEELRPPKAAWRPVKRRRRKMRVLDTDDEFVEESCTQALTVLKPSVADSKQSLPEMPKVSEKAAQREAKTADNLDAAVLTITETNPSSLMQSQTVQLPSRVADIQVNSEDAAKKETNVEAAELAAELKEKTSSLNASLSSDSCNTPAFMSPLFAANTSQDERYREIDSRMQSMFASPPRSALNFTSKTPIACSPLAPDFNVSQTFVSNESVQSITPAELTVDETNRLEQSGSKLEANSTLDDSTASAGTKNISLGLSDYRFEKVSDNVVNLFITRKRRGKRPRAQLEHNLATTTAS